MNTSNNNPQVNLALGQIPFNTEWLDRNNIPVGLLNWAIANLVAGQSCFTQHLFETLPRCGPYMVQFHVMRELNGSKHGSSIRIRYTAPLGSRTANYELTEHALTVKLVDDKTPVQIWRPYYGDEGKIVYQMVMERVAQKFTHDQPPVYMNYLLKNAERLIQDVLQKWRPEMDANDDFMYDNFAGHYCIPRPMSDYNNVVVTDAHRQWYSLLVNWVINLEAIVTAPQTNIVTDINMFAKAITNLLHHLPEREGAGEMTEVDMSEIVAEMEVDLRQ